MNIGIVDVDLIDKGTRHPNLALMKLSDNDMDIKYVVFVRFSNEEIEYLQIILQETLFKMNKNREKLEEIGEYIVEMY